MQLDEVKPNLEVRDTMNTESLWFDTTPAAAFPRLDQDLQVDVLIVGGGITGLTAAYLICKTGRSVALVERGTIGNRETGHTTAHLTYATDVRLSDLVKRFGPDHARAAWEAGASAMAQIQALVAEHQIECELRRTPAFLVVAGGADVRAESERLREEANVASEMGFNAEFVEKAPLLSRPAMRLANQMKFHPMKYAQALAREITRMGGQIFENTEVTEFHDNPRQVVAGGHRIAFDLVVLATHVPLQANRNALCATLLQTKLVGFSTYAIEARIVSVRLPELIWWDTGDPYLYLRIDRHKDHDVMILGGEDHKTGQKKDTQECFQRLERKLRSIVPDAIVERHWSGQVIESVDGLPYIGEVGDGQFLATGFAGNGMTFGTLAGMMACDAATGAKNPWQKLFSADRKVLGAAWNFLRENSDYPRYLAKGHLAGTESYIADMKRGEGRIVRANGRKAAVFCDDEQRLHVLSAICPHLGCVVVWNEAERTWDCPCHGSRFQATGEVISGPAESDLERIQISDQV
jgi:glycine/D-amino acid oxidase-like deaminating enzyme/nitrite reductase/ring-hydroxylating ferredoxin subunit